MSFASALPWKRNENQSPRTTTRHLLSSLFNDENEEYITSDYYGCEMEGRDEISTARSGLDSDGDRDPPSSSDSPNSNSSSSSPRSMDFVTFDGVWDDCADTSSRTDDNLPWQFMEFGFDESAETPRIANLTTKIKKKTSSISKSKGKLIRVYDTEKPSPFPLQNITNKTNGNGAVKVNTKLKGCDELKINTRLKVQEVNYRVQQPRAQQRGLHQMIKNNPFQATALRTKERNEEIWSKRLLSSSVATSPTLSASLSEDDKFWDDIFSQPPSLSKRIKKVAYSKRSAANDGSLIQNEKPEQIKDRDLYPNRVHMKTSYWTEMNKRCYMEDRVMIDSLGNVPLPSSNGLDMDVLFRKLQAIKSNRQGETLYEKPDRRSGSNPTFPLSLFATFDGHAGHLASQYCSDWFSSYLQKQPTYPHDLPLALRTAFHSIDEDFVKSGNEDGSTCCVCAVVGKYKVICANAGDSRAIIVRRDGDVISLSRDHKPGSPRENKRIKDLGGRIVYHGRWRVEG